MDSSLDVFYHRKNICYIVSVFTRCSKTGNNYDKVVIVRSLYLQERINFLIMMKKTKDKHYTKYHIKTWSQFMFEQPNEDVLWEFI